MKKQLFFGLFAAVSMLCAATFVSCTEDEPKATSTTHVALKKPAAVGDATGLTLVYEVYDAAGQKITDLSGEQTGVFTTADETVEVPLELIHSQEYTVVFWAYDAAAAVYDITNGLQDIKINYTSIKNNQTAHDAFFASKTFIADGTSQSIELTRPFAQLNLAIPLSEVDKATAAEVTLSKSAVVISELAVGFNALTGKTTDEKAEDVTFAATNIPTTDITINVDGTPTAYKHLSLTYVLPYDPAGSGNVLADVTFTVNTSNSIIFESNGTPLKRNFRTNVIGSIVSPATFNVVVDNAFADTTAWELAAMEDVASGVRKMRNTYFISSLDGMKWLMNESKTNSFEGYTIQLQSTISLTSISSWTPLGSTTPFKGTFDGAGFTLSYLKVNASGDAPAGLFANIDGGTVKNLTLSRPNINGHGVTGAIVANANNATIDSCTVTNATIVITPYNKQGGINIGACVGSVTGTTSITRCTAGTSNKITGYSNIGALVGVLNSTTATIEGNFTKTNTLTVDRMCEYDTPIETNVTALVGYNPNNVDVENNTVYATNTIYIINASPDDPNTMLIGSRADLDLLSIIVNAGNTFAGKTAKLTADIDLTNTNTKQIGTSSYPFKGTFDGDGHKLSNLRSYATMSNNMGGLFKYTSGGEIKNLVIENMNVFGKQYVGGLVAHPSSTDFTNITLQGLIKVEGYYNVGGLVGQSATGDYTNITINADEGSYVRTMTNQNRSRSYVGGMIGFIDAGTKSISNCHANINVRGTTCDVGGISGNAQYGTTFTNCSSSGSIQLTNASGAHDGDCVGGIAGNWTPNNAGVITFTGCTFTGSVSTNVEGVDVTNNTIVGGRWKDTGGGTLIIDGQEVTD